MRTAIAIAAALFAAPAAQAANIVAAQSATASSEYGASYSIANAIDGSGLSAAYVVGADFDAYVAGGPTHSYYANTEWFAAYGVTTATVTYDLGGAYALEGFALWNEDAAGIVSAQVSVSTDGSAWTSAGTIAPTDNATAASYGADVFALAAVAQYVRLDMGCAGSYC